MKRREFITLLGGAPMVPARKRRDAFGADRVVMAPNASLRVLTLTLGSSVKPASGF